MEGYGSAHQTAYTATILPPTNQESLEYPKKADAWTYMQTKGETSGLPAATAFTDTIQLIQAYIPIQ